MKETRSSIETRARSSKSALLMAAIRFTPTKPAGRLAPRAADLGAELLGRLEDRGDRADADEPGAAVRGDLAGEAVGRVDAHPALHEQAAPGPDDLPRSRRGRGAASGAEVCSSWRRWWLPGMMALLRARVEDGREGENVTIAVSPDVTAPVAIDVDAARSDACASAHPTTRRAPAATVTRRVRVRSRPLPP